MEVLRCQQCAAHSGFPAFGQEMFKVTLSIPTTTITTTKTTIKTTTMIMIIIIIIIKIIKTNKRGPITRDEMLIGADDKEACRSGKADMIIHALLINVTPEYLGRGRRLQLMWFNYSTIQFNDETNNTFLPTSKKSRKSSFERESRLLSIWAFNSFMRYHDTNVIHIVSMRYT